MEIHHDASFRSILEDDFISSTFIAHIRSCLNKRAGLWLIIKPSICLFCIAHYTFTLALHFHLDLIQPSTFSLLKCECGHGLATFDTHLPCYLFEGQRITTHDAIRDVMYVFTRESGQLICTTMERTMVHFYIKSFITS
jgi:hypothetical protein